MGNDNGNEKSKQLEGNRDSQRQPQASPGQGGQGRDGEGGMKGDRKDLGNAGPEELDGDRAITSTGAMKNEDDVASDDEDDEDALDDDEDSDDDEVAPEGRAG